MLSMLVCKEVTSNVTRKVRGGTASRFSICLMKSGLSRMYDGSNGMYGHTKWSTNPEMRSVGHWFVLTMGQPGGGWVVCGFWVVNKIWQFSVEKKTNGQRHGGRCLPFDKFHQWVGGFDNNLWIYSFSSFRPWHSTLAEFCWRMFVDFLSDSFAECVKGGLIITLGIKCVGIIEQWMIKSGSDSEFVMDIRWLVG